MDNTTVLLEMSALLSEVRGLVSEARGLLGRAQGIDVNLPTPDSYSRRPKLRAAVELLRRELANGPAPVKEIMRRAKSEGISKRQMETARKILCVRPNCIGFGGTWHLALPPSTNDGA